MTPEAVLLELPTAGVATRAFARLVDLVVQLTAAALLGTVGAFAVPAGFSPLLLFLALGFTVLLVLPIGIEIIWRGRSPGKAMFGLQAIESLAMGTPIICAAGPDSNEWTGNSQGGLVMRSGDSFDLQRKLRMMLDDPEELKVMGQRSVQFARENYDRNRRTERMYEIYERACRRRADLAN